MNCMKCIVNYSGVSSLSIVYRLFAQSFVRVQIKDNIKDDRRIPRTKGQ